MSSKSNSLSYMKAIRETERAAVLSFPHFLLYQPSHEIITTKDSARCTDTMPIGSVYSFSGDIEESR